MAQTQPKLIVGLGTGRCGTRSLRRLMSLQPGVEAVHERKPALFWRGESDPGRHLRQGLRFDCRAFADIGFYYLPHVEALREEFAGVTFVCLQRDREETIESFCKHQERGRNWFTDIPGLWNGSFPTIAASSFAEQVARYWDSYYEAAQRLCGDDFRIFPTTSLSDERAEEILRFCGFESPVIEPVHVGAGAP